MKPLATPVLGGMVSSLLHVLIVTPVIFTWMHEREIGREPIAETSDDPGVSPAAATRKQLRRRNSLNADSRGLSRSMSARIGQTELNKE